MSSERRLRREGRVSKQETTEDPSDQEFLTDTAVVPTSDTNSPVQPETSSLSSFSLITSNVWTRRGKLSVLD